MTRAAPASGIRAEFGRFLRFASVGAAASLTYASLVSILVSGAEAPPFVTGVAVYAALVPVAYAGQRAFAFPEARGDGSTFSRYAAVQVLAVLVVSAVTSRLLSGHPAIDAAIWFATAGGTSLLAFAVNRLVVFRPADGTGR
jgi:putative flippase GtrA